MCGIVGAVGHRDISQILLEGLQRLEYRGYDSAGIAVIDQNSEIQSSKLVGKVRRLQEHLQEKPLNGHTGIAHTRWATHGQPSEANAHPHLCLAEVAIVHNGIIENHEVLRARLKTEAYQFNSETDSEVIVNLIHSYQKRGRESLDAVSDAIAELEGAYAIAVIFKDQPQRIITARHGSPLVVGIGEGEYFVASDIFAVLAETHRYIILQDGDIADINLNEDVRIYDSNRQLVQRQIMVTDQTHDASDKTGYRHYMLKEIFEQPLAISKTLEHTIIDSQVQDLAFGADAGQIFDQTNAVQIVACGTSYHAGLVASYWIEAIARISCKVDIASEYRYRDALVQPGTLFVSISQSGETADTLAALHKAKSQAYTGTLAICNVAESSMTRESELVFLTRAGVEIGVASTKAFTTQLVALMLLTLALAKRHGLESSQEQKLTGLLADLPDTLTNVLELDDHIAQVAEKFVHKEHTLYLGRGSMLPVAMEGALKLKEISYIHAEAYAAGELKHGPLALVDENMPVVVVAPNNDLLIKLISNLHEVYARGGELYVFADSSVDLAQIDDVHKIEIAPVDNLMAPIVFVVPLQLFAYHVAVLKGADIDQPRNLAKSVTVE